MRLRVLLSVLFVGLLSGVFAQKGSVSGILTDEISNEPIPFANIIIRGTNQGVATDIDGLFLIEGIDPGFVQLQISVLGYQPLITPDIQITSNRKTNFNVKLEKTAKQMKEFVVTANPYNKTAESPLSMQTIGVTEIERAAGANRDISKVIQSFPGVTSTPAFRNDIIIRGGAPNENRFYLDEIEVPNINHFQTQGASGGPVGIINVNLIREVDFQAGAFPASRGNMLSSLLSFKQLDGNTEKLKGKVTVGSSDLGISLDGPLGKKKKTTFVFSARQSYLQFLFQALKLPFLPTYWDYQTKVKHKINKKNEISLISIGSLDNTTLNTKANETIEQRYILQNIPTSDQWTYAIGAVYKHFEKNSFQTYVLSRNMLNNAAEKYMNNDESSENNLILRYKSQEIENKFRFENTTRINGWKLTGGVNYEYAKYNNSTFNKIYRPASFTAPARFDTVSVESALNLNKYGAFGQVSRRFMGSRLSVSVGVRVDGTDFNSEMSNVLNQIAPRLSASYDLTDQYALNFAVGRFTQLPAYTSLGYRQQGELVNDNLKYTTANHINGGIEYRPKAATKITLEGFYKYYDQYPMAINKGISLANLGADFGVVGNELLTSTSEGRAYGLEFMAQQKLFKGFYGILSYTLVRSEFKNADGKFAPSSWDSEHLLTFTGGKKFKKNWEVGARWRYVHGRPTTPYDLNVTALRSVYDINPAGVVDYTRINAERLPAFHQLDVRVDKTWNFKKWSLNLYFDIQNLYAFKAKNRPILFPKEVDGEAVILNPNDPYQQQRYDMQEIESTSGTVLPTTGIIINF